MTEVKTNKNKRIILTAVYTAYTLFIFSNSMQDAAESSGRSMAVLELIDKIIGSGVITEHIIRKAAHFTEFAVLGILGGYTAKLYGLGFAHAAFAGLLTAVADETLQLFSEGRSSQISDVWIDFAGCMAGILLVTVLIRVIRKHYDIR